MPSGVYKRIPGARRKKKRAWIEGVVGFIPLQGELTALVDAEDVARVDERVWHRNAQGYAVSNVRDGDRAMLRMHRFVLGVADDDPCEVDHRNRNRLDNRKANLRRSDRRQNGANLSRKKNNTSGFIGVTRCASTGRWKARVKVDHREVWLGRFGSAEDAARAYDEAAKQHHGEFASLNFPEERAEKV